MWLTRLELINLSYLEIKKREEKVNINISKHSNSHGRGATSQIWSTGVIQEEKKSARAYH